MDLLPQATQKASLGLEGADGDLNEDSIGVTGLGCPAGNDVDGNAFTFSSVLLSAKRTFCFLLGVSSPPRLLPPTSLFIAYREGSSGAGIGIGSGNNASSFSQPLPPSGAFAIAASASSFLNFNITRSRGMSVCAAGNASALLSAAMILPPKLV